LNFKEKYASAFPGVETVHTHRGLIVTREKLDALGMVAPAAPPPAANSGITVEDIRAVKELADRLGADQVKVLAEVLGI
jgi:hypothetical protein